MYNVISCKCDGKVFPTAATVVVVCGCCKQMEKSIKVSVSY